MAKIWVPIEVEVSSGSVKSVIDDMQNIIDNAERRKASAKKIIELYQELCVHKYSNGKSAIVSTAISSPYDVEKCEICGKIFNDG